MQVINCPPEGSTALLFSPRPPLTTSEMKSDLLSEVKLSPEAEAMNR